MKKDVVVVQRIASPVAHIDEVAMNTIEAACAFLGWQGGTIHDVRRELAKREDEMIRQYNQMDEETDEEVVLRLHMDIAEVQVLQMEPY